MTLNRKNKIAVSLLISYILVLMVPYIVHRIGYASIENALMDEIKNYNAEYLSGRTNTLDETIANVSEMVNTIYLNSEFQETARLKGTLTPKQLYSLSLDKSYIYGGFDFYIENAIVLYKNIDYYVGQKGSGHLHNFYNAHYADLFHSFEEWYEFMTRRYYGEVVLYSDSENQGRGSLYYILSYMDPGDSNSLLANIIVEFKKSFLLSENNNKNTFFLVDADNRVVVCNEDEEFVEKANDALKREADSSIVQIEIDKQEKILIMQEMKQSDLKYASCISKDVFLEKMYNSRRNYIYTMITCVLAGVVIILWGVKRHYLPIRNITRVLSRKYNNDSHLDEYQYLTSVTNKIINEYLADGQYQMMEKKLAMNSFLLSILKGEELVMSDAIDKLEYFGVKFKNNWFCVAYLWVKDYSNLFFEETEQENNLNLSKMIIENIYSDIIKDKCEFAFCDNGKSIF